MCASSGLGLVEVVVLVAATVLYPDRPVRALLPGRGLVQSRSSFRLGSGDSGLDRLAWNIYSRIELCSVLT